MSLLIFWFVKKENVDSLRLLRYRQTPNNPKRANAHAKQRELSTSVLDCFYKFCRFLEDKNQKWTFILCPYIFAMLPYAVLF